MFLVYGVALIWCARDVQRKRFYINVLAAAFFVGATGRLLATILVGTPHLFYVAMLALELALPPLMVLAAKRIAEPVPILAVQASTSSTGSAWAVRRHPAGRR